MDPFVGEVRTFPWSFPPKNWALCNGALLPINQYQALFALLGTYYGGNGTTNFALPDLRGRTPFHYGNGGGQAYNIGQQGGAETVTLSVSTLPSHNHNMTALGGTPGNIGGPGGIPATVGQFVTGKSVVIYAPSNSTPTVVLNNASVSNAGGGGAHNNVQPFLVVNFCIALQGVFPSRS